MTICIGVDGGGTGCRGVLADASGRVLARAEAGPANIAFDPDTAHANLRRLFEALTAQIGGADPAQVSAVLGLAGANVPQAAARLSGHLGFARHRIVSDALTTTFGALRGADGIVAAMGTGSVLGVVRHGQFAQYGGRGFVLGDEGSGAVLGRALLARALRAADGFDPMTPLLRAVLDEFGGAEGVIAFGIRATPAEFARFAPRLVASDDPAAHLLFDTAAQQIAAMIDHLQGAAALPVVFLGGLGPAYAARLQGRWDIRPAQGTALDGALLLAQALWEKDSA
jgi:glucosamine kinase